jgi:hypothetical protein
MSQQCKAASLRAYRELQDRGVPESAAFESAIAVFRFYHPMTPPEESRQLIAGWIDEHKLGLISGRVCGRC